MKNDKYAENLGRLVINMHSLELALRVFLYHVYNDLEDNHSHFNFDTVQAGDMVQVNALTNWDTLEKLIQKYNKSSQSDGYKINESLVNVRDALAHGRSSTLHPELAPMRLLKFAEPKKAGKGMVEVVFADYLTKEWFNEKINLFHDAIQKVEKTGYLSEK